MKIILPGNSTTAPLGTPQSNPGRWVRESAEVHNRIAALMPSGATLRAVCSRPVRDGRLAVVISSEFDAMQARWALHLSISHPSRNPTWEEIRDARYDLLPDALTFAMLLPPREEYVNVHEFCFHLHELPAGAIARGGR